MPRTIPTLEKAVIAVAKQEEHAMATGDIALYLSLLDDQAVFLPPNAAGKRGDELRAWLTDFLAHFDVQWLCFHHGETVVTGELATHDYSYGMLSTPRNEGEPILSFGKGVEAIRRQQGEWKILRNIWNATPHHRAGVR